MAEWKTETYLKESGGQKLLGVEQGAINGFSMGCTFCYATEYADPATHGDQEGFYVVSGEGFVKLGDEEYAISPGMCFIARAGEAHALRRTSSEPLKVVWAHGPVS